MKYISVDEYLMGRIAVEQLSPELLANLNTIVPRANMLLERAGLGYRPVNSGYRSHKDQDRINPKAPLSKHTICAAVDLKDDDSRLDLWCKMHQDVLAEIGLWLEDPISTPGWCHVQSIAPASGHRIFIP